MKFWERSGIFDEAFGEIWRLAEWVEKIRKSLGKSRGITQLFHRNDIVRSPGKSSKIRKSMMTSSNKF